MKQITISEKYNPAMKITDQDKADYYFKCLVEYTMHFDKSFEEAVEIEKSNLGYYAGYCDNATRLRIELLFKCAHPIFGPITKGVPTLEEAFNLGESWGRDRGKQ